MSARIAMRYTVALEGFSDFEHNALASFFRLAEQRAPAYSRAASLAESDFIIANADSAVARMAVAQADRLPDTVFIGASAPPGAGSWLTRPIAPTHIVRELDLLLEQRLACLDEPVVVADPAEAATDQALVVDAHRQAPDVLVVDDSRIALRFLQKRLQRLGYRVHLARDATQALAQLATQAFSLVFLDVTLGPPGTMDGLTLCQHIKQRAHQPGGVVPSVVMVTGMASSTDKVRGTLAGCDAYLTKPLMEDEFIAMLKQLDRGQA